MNGADKDSFSPLERLRQQAQGPFNDISRSTLDRRIVACGNAWRLGPLPPATTQRATLGQWEDLTDLLLPLSHPSIRRKEALPEAPGLLQRQRHPVAVLGVAP
jgi:hypothetical protein